MIRAWAAWACLCLCLPAGADVLYGDARPDAPELAARGEAAVGVRTLDLVHADQLDVLAISARQPAPRYDRALRVEIWYPARLAAGQKPLTTYTDVLGAGPGDSHRPNTPFTFQGRAVRDAGPADGRYPLVILSHGYPGSRLQMSYLAEHLASHGYIVAALDHRESTRADKAGFASTLVNRPLDDLFVLQQLADAGHWAQTRWLAGHLDSDRSALIGYSMGGYGALRAAGVAPSAAARAAVPPGALDPTVTADARIKALVLFAPWGGQQGMFESSALAALAVPSLFIAGDQDDVAGYTDGVRRLFEAATQAERYLLVYRGARHNVAPNPPPAAARSHPDDFAAYAEPVWDSARLNNINQHFVLAFLDQQLKGLDRQAYLRLIPRSDDGQWQMDAQGRPGPGHTYWHGFKRRSAVGLEFHRLPAGQSPSVP
ncbi:alpha/beta fold hydrolase [Pseudomonas sp. S75]|uniref:alpha/beta hydrolase family protein n=1 Tax=unclassified Pseudomonas TaxID=196821 RepID=UPI0019053BE5|nr:MULTISPECIES: alpha/beta fold hydrolase [unclassified Pseudomonas]MBJ9977648.1 alpha/beta fold hydrolase [Pseudomonas sp. S30]MBK0155020.1 alpha/beta fold hydrolase [Pseudomonas sp. S75]